MKGFKSNIENDTLKGKNFRKVLYSGEHLQLVLMSLLPNEEIGLETHPDNDQFFRFESGQGKCIINGIEHLILKGDTIIVPAGTKHNVINTSNEKMLKFYTIYSPPHHEDGIIRETKQEAEAKGNEEEFDGVTTE